MPFLDTLGRRLGTLRLSVTDRCNFRCHYCMPEDEYVWLPRGDLLTFDEIVRVADLVAAGGATRIRITGGEPLLRHDLPHLVSMLAKQSWLTDLALTTNGALLAEAAMDLQRAGLHRVTVSLDTLRRDRFARLTRADALPHVLAGIDAALGAGFPRPLKLDSVITRGDNDDELVDLVEFARAARAEIRFIEYMDVGGATSWRPDRVVSRDDMLRRLGDHYGPIRSLAPLSTSAPAERFALPDGLTFGIIASTTAPFCGTCDRARLTADGILLLCLYARHGTDLRRPLRAGASTDTLARLVRAVWESRADRGAEERRFVTNRGAYIPVQSLKRDAHLEMHTRGG